MENPDNKQPFARPATLTQVRDGLTNTSLLAERAGLPIVAASSRIAQHFSWLEGEVQPRGRWMSQDSWSDYYVVNGRSGMEIEKVGLMGINSSNYFNIYAFHRGGAHVVMCDGSTRFLSEGLDALTQVGLLTRDGEEPVTAN